MGASHLLSPCPRILAKFLSSEASVSSQGLTQSVGSEKDRCKNPGVLVSQKAVLVPICLSHITQSQLCVSRPPNRDVWSPVPYLVASSLSQRRDTESRLLPEVSRSRVRNLVHMLRPIGSIGLSEEPLTVSSA